MKIAAMILGILGGVFGLVGAVLALIVGGVVAAGEASGTSQVIGLGWSAFAFAILGIIGGGLALNRPRVAGGIMLVAAVGGTISISFAFILAAPLLLVGGLLGIFSKRTPASDATGSAVSQNELS